MSLEIQQKRIKKKILSDLFSDLQCNIHAWIASLYACVACENQASKTRAKAWFYVRHIGFHVLSSSLFT